MAVPITLRFITVALDRMDDLPADIVVSLKDDDISGFARLPNMVEIDYIEVPHDLQGHGYGSKVLKILTQTADEMDVTLVLHVAQMDDPAEEEDWPMSFEDLSSWYERYGFHGDRKMVRHPQSEPISQQ